MRYDPRSLFGLPAARSRLRTLAALGALAAGAWLLAMPATSAAEVFEARASNPPGSGLGTPSQEIVSARAQYDTNGQITVSATMNGEVASGPKTFYSFAVGSYQPPETCGGVTVSLFGDSTGKDGRMTITGAEKTSTALTFVFGKTLSITSYDNTQQLAHKPFSCVTLAVASSEGGKVLDRLAAPMWFPGFGPGPSPTPGPTPVGIAPLPGSHAAPKAPVVSAFATKVKVKRQTGAGTLVAKCGLPSSEVCTFSLTLYVAVKHGHKTSQVKVGTVSGKIRGGQSGKLALRLNAAGRRLLGRGAVHAEAKGSVKSTAGLVTRFHRRITISRK
jgi:hypothetical protein